MTKKTKHQEPVKGVQEYELQIPQVAVPSHEDRQWRKAHGFDREHSGKHERDGERVNT